ncbi:hypothetical protein EON65_43645 [archaeon]|nr:MAG: hypothetical protein EON65_43645 [archaeon]
MGRAVSPRAWSRDYFYLFCLINAPTMGEDDWDDDDNESDYMDESTLQSNESSPKVEVFKRRANQLNPHIKISEITKPIRTHIAEKDKKAIPKRTEVFKFHCEGDIQSHDMVDGKHVEWKATFDKPIEQLIYPSLQRFDNEAFEEKRKAYKILHGQHETVVPSAGSPTGVCIYLMRIKYSNASLSISILISPYTSNTYMHQNAYTSCKYSTQCNNHAYLYVSTPYTYK